MHDVKGGCVLRKGTNRVASHIIYFTLGDTHEFDSKELILCLCLDYFATVTWEIVFYNKESFEADVQWKIIMKLHVN